LGRLERLPVQAQGVISTALGAGDARFGAQRTAFGYRLGGGGVVANLSRRGVDLNASGESVRLSLKAIGRGGREHLIGATAPVGHRNRVVFRHHEVAEWYAAGPLGVEQGLTLARRPTGRGRALTMVLGVGGGLVGRRSGSGLVFLARSGNVALRYGGLAAIDASGRRLQAQLALQRGRVLVRVVDRGARYPLRIDPFIQQGAKLIGNCSFGCSGPSGSDESGEGEFGFSVALSADGGTALIGAPLDSGHAGAAWVFTRSGGTWSEQGLKLIGAGETGQGEFGFSVALSADSSTALIGGLTDNANAGAVWAFTRAGGIWSPQGPKLMAGDESGGGEFGESVALAADGNTALIGGGADSASAGAVWIFTRSSAAWSQQGLKLTGAGESGAAAFGQSVSLSSDGNTALVGGSGDRGGVGAAWVLTRSGAAWSQQELTGAGETGPGAFGKSVSLSAAGSTALIGAWQDDSGAGAAWVFTRSGAAWSQQKLIGAGESSIGELGYSVALSADADTALVGAVGDNGGIGAAFVFIRSGANWSQQGTKLIGDCSGVCSGPDGSGEVGGGEFGVGVALSRDATTALVGAQQDSSFVGAAWVFTQPATCTDVGASTPAGGGAASVPLSCSGPPGVSLNYAIVTPPAHGALRPIDQSTGTVTYISQPGYIGADTFTYDASDSVGAANLATATITIPPLPPTCKNVKSRTRPGGGAARVGLSCTAAAGVPFSYTIVSRPSHGSLSAVDQRAGSLVYLSRLGYHGTDHFRYRAIDSGGASNTATSTITVPKPLGTLAFALLGWTFEPLRTYSKVTSMTGSDLPIGTNVIIACGRHRCRFKPRKTAVKAVGCKQKQAHCRRKHGVLTRALDLTAHFHGLRLPLGGDLTVSFVKTGFVGKVYIFHVRSGKQPTWQATCLAPGSLKPGRGC
jgi:Bacterial Ig domain/FG-GAP repeat